MNTCVHRDKGQICAWDAKNKYQLPNDKLIEEWTESGRQGLLICPECGAEVFFRPCHEKSSHFAHKRGASASCTRSGKETKDHFEAKEALYFHFTTKYRDDAKVTPCYRHPNGRISDLYIEFRTGERLAVNYQRQELPVGVWRERHSDYDALGISDLWILSADMDKHTAHADFFARFIQGRNPDDVVLFLDVARGQLSVNRLAVYEDGDGTPKEWERIYETYLLNDVKILPTGRVQCDFEKLFAKYSTIFFERMRARDRREQEAAALQKRLLEQYRASSARAGNSSQLRSETPRTDRTPPLLAHHVYHEPQMTDAVYSCTLTEDHYAEWTDGDGPICRHCGGPLTKHHYRVIESFGCWNCHRPSEGVLLDQSIEDTRSFLQIRVRQSDSLVQLIRQQTGINLAFTAFDDVKFYQPYCSHCRAWIGERPLKLHGAVVTGEDDIYHCTECNKWFL